MGEGRMRKREGQPLIGRFIKASDAKILDKMSLADFSFKEISQTPVAALDNLSSSVMRTQYHDSDELSSVIREHESLDLELRSKESIRPVLQPIDFTIEWNELKDRMNKKRDLKMEDDDDEEFEMALANMEAKEREVDESESLQAESNEVAASVEIPQEDPNQEEGEGYFKFKKNENVESTTDIPLSQEPELDSAPEMSGLADQISLLGNEDEGTNELSSSIKATGDEENRNDEFIPVDMSDNKSFDQGEVAASDKYKSIQQEAEIKQQYEDQLNKLFDEAKSQGYEEGFKQGEEKASIQIQQNATEVIDNLAGVVSELEKLKKTILENTQENFYEIAQAVAEALLRREFAVNPSSFAEVLRRAINDSVQDDDIKIAVHPETYSKLMEIDISDLKEKLVRDENLKSGDFRIDSTLSVVDGNIKEMVSDLMEQANLDLFDESDDGEKVG